MQQFVGGQRLNLGLADGHHGDGLSHRVENFQAVARFLAGLARMELHHRRHVSAAEPVLRQVRLQSHPGEQFIFHSLSGNKVTNFVWFVASSFIQIVTTRKARPFGPVSVPRIRYFGPYSVCSKQSASNGRICWRMSLSSRSALSRV